jgi:hypothetical protein
MDDNLNLLLGLGPPKGARKLTRKDTPERAPDVSRDIPPEEMGQ